MKRIHWAFALVPVVVSPVWSQPPAAPRPKNPPKLAAVAETKLVMEGIAHVNFRGIEKILSAKEIDAESWAFARGQALLVAETGNLLMLRPPNNSGQEAWMKQATELRESSAQLAKTLARRDRDRSRAGLTQLANVCNSCHQSFNVKTRIKTFEEP